ncbi:MAG TPA: MFS transporter [Aeromicrobium sp.]|nr:MFS transporter [Aeromicrobium sp.]
MTSLTPRRAVAPVARLWCSVFAGYLAFGGTLQTLPGWLRSQFDAGPATVGLAVGIAFVATAICRPFAGRAGDAGRARGVVMTGGALIVCGAVGQWLAPHVTVLLLARLVMGAGEAALFSGALPWALSSAPPDRQGRFAGWFGLSMWGGLALGPIVASAVTLAGGENAAWLTIVALGLASFAVVVTGPVQMRHDPVAQVRSTARADLVARGALLPGVMFCFAAYGYGAVSAVLLLYLTDAHLGGSHVGLAVFGAAFVVSRSVGSPLVDRFGGAAVAAVMLSIEAVGFALLVAAPTLVAALTGAALAGAGVSLIFPSAVWLALERDRTAGAGASAGTIAAFWDIGIFIAGIASGLIAATIGYRVAFGAALAVVVAGLAVALVLWRQPSAGRAS